MRARAPPFGSGPESGPDASDAGRDRAQTTLDFAVGMSIFLLTVAFVFTFAPNIAEPFSDSGTENTVVADRAASQLVAGTLADPDRPYVLDKACTMAFFAPENLDGEPTNGQDLNDSNDNAPDELQDYSDVAGESIYSDACTFLVSVSNDSDYLHARLGVAGIAADGSIDRALSPGLQIEIRGDADDDGNSALLCSDAEGSSSPGETDPIIETTDAYDGSDGCDASSGDYDIPFQAGEDPPEDSGSVVVARRVVTIDGIRATVFVRVW
jgi:hypothetical protein